MGSKTKRAAGRWQGGEAGRIPASIAVPVHQTSTGSEPLVLASRPSTVERAIHDFERISAEFRRRFDAGDRGAVFRFLDVCPDAAGEDWVRRALEQLRQHPEEGARGRGRPPGEAADTFPRALHLVLLVDRLHRETGKPLDLIFKELAESGSWGMGVEGLRKRYFRAIHDPRITSVLFTYGKC